VVGGRGRPVDGSGGSNNNWGRSVGLDWGRGISRSRGISRGRGICRLSRVLDISNIAIAISVVGDGLDAAIGKGNVVLSVGVVAVTGFTCTKIGATVAVSHTIVVVVGWDSVGVDGLSSISWDRNCVLGGSSSGSHKGKESNKALK
jgi:hypothetical protein